MHYQSIYASLMERAKDRNLTCYTEKHRIVPGCMGGKYEADNVVRLTPEEHYVAHQLLVKMYPEHLGLVEAAMKMTVNSGSTQRCNKLYGWLRRKSSEAHKARWKDPEFRKRRKESMDRKWKDPIYLASRQSMHNDPAYRSKRSEIMNQQWSDPAFRSRRISALRLPRGKKTETTKKCACGFCYVRLNKKAKEHLQNCRSDS